MKLFCRHGLFLLFLLLPWELRPATPLVSWSYTDSVENLAGKVLWQIDEKARLSPDEVWAMEASLFRPFEELKSAIPRGATLWGKFRIGAAGPGDTTLRHLMLFTRHDRFALFLQDGDERHAFRAGSVESWFRLPLRANFMAIPVQPYEGGARDALIRIRNDNLDKIKLDSLYLLTPAQEKQVLDNVYKARREKHLFYVSFLWIAGFLFVFYFLQWFIHRERAVLFYALFVAANVLYYWRNFEIYFEIQPFIYRYVTFLHYHFEVLFSFGICYCYIKFVGSFLDIPQKRPALARAINRIAWAVLWAVPILWGIQLIAGTTAMYGVFTLVRIILFVPALVIIADALLKSPRRLAAFILIGGLILVMSALPPVISKLPGFGMYKFAGNALGYLTVPGNLHIPIFDFKIGLLLEFLCFSIGLAYKQRLLREENRELNARLALPFTPNENNGQHANGIPAHAGPAAVVYPFSLDSDFSRRVTAQIEKHLGEENFGVNELAVAMHLGRTQLYRSTKKTTGLTPVELIRTIRLHHGRLLLENEGKTIAEIAYAVGFGSPSYFAQQFKEVYGVSPSELKKGR